MQTSGGVLTVTGGHFDSPYRPEVRVPHSGVVRGAEGAVEAVREEVKRGADWIKLLVTGGVMTGTAPLGRSLWDEAELRAAVQAAGRLGRQVAAHCHGAEGIVAAAEAGVSTVEHGTLGDEAAAAAMARHAVTLIPTFTAAAGVARAAQEGRLTPAVARMAVSLERTHDQAFRAAVAAGVRVALGTDTGVPGTAFGQNAGELALLVSHGLTPEQALLAATRDAAAVLGRGGELGALVEGALADCLLLDGDPLQSAGALTQPDRVHLVLQGGKVVADRRPDRP
jgi:imidazolonepropionase-like amidohydrolase